MLRNWGEAPINKASRTNGTCSVTIGSAASSSIVVTAPNWSVSPLQVMPRSLRLVSLCSCTEIGDLLASTLSSLICVESHEQMKRAHPYQGRRARGGHESKTQQAFKLSLCQSPLHGPDPERPEGVK